MGEPFSCDLGLVYINTFSFQNGALATDSLPYSQRLH